MINLKQKELLDWQNKNFTDEKLEELSRGELIQMVKLLQTALGICEEAGEVAHHILKGTQNIRGGINGVNKDQVADGIADGLIFGLQTMSALGLNAENEITKTIETVLSRDWVNNKETGKITCD